MKKILIILVILWSTLISAQTLTIPVTQTYGPLGDTLEQWDRRAWIDANSSDETNSVYDVKDGWNPQSNDIINIISAGGNTSNVAFYFRITDSLFFASAIPSNLGTNLYDIQGRYTTELLTWGNFLEVDHEIYWQSNTNNYYVLALKADGTRMTLGEANQIRIDNAYVASVHTVNYLKGINQTLLYKRTAFNVWENNQF